MVSVSVSGCGAGVSTSTDASVLWYVPLSSAQLSPVTLTGKISSGSFKFVGTYDPVLLPADGHYRFVGADGKQLVTPNAEGNLKGLRAYFFMPSLYDNCKYDSNGKPRSVRISMDRGKSSSK